MDKVYASGPFLISSNSLRIIVFTGREKAELSTRASQTSSGLGSWFKILLHISIARLSWRIAFWVFTSILTVEILILIPATFRREREKLKDLQMETMAIFQTTLNLSSTDNYEILINEFQKAAPGDLILGGELYNPTNQQTLASFGSTPKFSFAEAQKAHDYYYRKDVDHQWYDIAWQPPALKGQFLIVRLDASPVNQYLRGYLRNIAILIMLISGYVTLATMIALGPIVLIPILRLRQDMILTGELITRKLSPDKIPLSSREQQDELGEVINEFQNMLHRIGSAFDERKQAEKALHLANQSLEEHAHNLEATLQELKNTQIQLIQTEKLSSLGRMVAGIAHEINNPMTFISGNIFHLQTYFVDLKELIQQYQSTYPSTLAIEKTIEKIDLAYMLKDIQKILDSLSSGTQRVQDIIISMRNFSRVDEAEFKTVNIHEGLDSTLLIFQHRLKQGVNVIKHYGQLPLVSCYPAQLNQVFSNLIANALDAMDEAQSEQPTLIISTKVSTDAQVQISFQDTGPGMSASVKERIFDPFFTTKPVGQGTGLGLGICYQIIKKHSGSIVVTSEIGQGSDFCLTLPSQVTLTDDTSENS